MGAILLSPNDLDVTFPESLAPTEYGSTFNRGGDGGRMDLRHAGVDPAIPNEEAAASLPEDDPRFTSFASNEGYIHGYYRAGGANFLIFLITLV